MADEPPRTQWVRLPTPSRGAPPPPTPAAGPPAPGPAAGPSAPVAQPPLPRSPQRIAPPPPEDPAAPFGQFQASPKTALLRKVEADQRKLSLLFALLMVLGATVAAGALLLWIVLF